MPFMKSLRRSFRAKILITYTGLWLTLTSVTGILIYQLIFARLQDKMAEELLAVGKLAAEQLQPELPRYLQPTFSDSSESGPLSSLLGSYLKAGVAENMTILDNQGTFLFDVTGEAVPGFRSATLGPGDLIKLGQGQSVTQPVHEDDFGLWRQSVFLPLRDGLVLEVVADPDYLEVLRSFRRLSMVLGGLGLLACGAISLFIARMVLKPVATVVEAAEQISKGHYPRVKEFTREDELGQLLRTLSSMSDKVQEREIELKSLRQAAEKQSEQMKEIAAGIAHEVRNPLGVLRTQADWIQKKNPEDSDFWGVGQKILNQVTNLDQLVTRFLEYSRSFSFQARSVAMDVLCQNLVNQLEPEARKQGVRLAKQIQPGCLIRGDQALLLGAFHNLGLNALEAMAKGGDLAIRAEREGSWIKVEVDDQGAGIPSKLLPQIFKPFFTTKSKGTGLGLAFVDKVVRAHEGRIEVVNKPEGGTVFQVYLPAWAGPA